MLNNKRGDVADLVSLFTVTIVIVMILVGFIVVIGMVKAFDKAKNGERIYKDAEVGVGDVRIYMEDYGRLVRAEGMIRKGELVERALVLTGYGKRVSVVRYGYYSGFGFLGGIYGR